MNWGLKYTFCNWEWGTISTPNLPEKTQTTLHTLSISSSRLRLVISRLVFFSISVRNCPHTWHKTQHQLVQHRWQHATSHAPPQRKISIFNESTECLKWCSMHRQSGKAYYVKYCMCVIFTNYLVFDWPKWCALWHCISSLLLSNQTSFQLLWHIDCQYINCYDLII